jgi:hypothetical protein
MRISALLIVFILIVGCGKHPIGPANSKNHTSDDDYTPSHSEQTHAELQIIVGFNNTRRDPEDPSLVMEMSALINADLAFVRRMSGNAAVYLCTAVDSEAQMIKKLQLLKQHDDIKYAEQDRMQKIQ